MKITTKYLRLLEGWVKCAENDIFSCPDRPDLVYYGDGTNGWGVQTNQKALAAFAVLASAPELDEANAGMSREKLLELALGMLRYSLESHIVGSYHTTDADDFHWGHTWISSLGVERMMHGVTALWDKLSAHDHELLRAMLVSESDWLLDNYAVLAGLTTNNKPESNMWNGAVMYRTAMMYPDTPRAAEYIEKAKSFFANSISTESDEHNGELLDGKPMSEYFVGANYFDSMACDHHHYMNVGYMVITLSNLAMLHFELKRMGKPGLQTLYHNMEKSWQLVRSCIFDDGRLNRIGGDTRVRYCYRQDYLIPVLMLAEDCGLSDADEILALEDKWLDIVAKEVQHNGDNSFLSDRCELLKEKSPLYYTRLESDRAVSLSYGALWHELFKMDGTAKLPLRPDLKFREPLTQWHDDYHGSYYVRSDNRMASFTWIAGEYPQGLCLPPEDSSMAEWRFNMSSMITGDGSSESRILLYHNGRTYDGGFAACGAYMAHTNGLIAEQISEEDTAKVSIAYAALPDDATVVTLQYAEAPKRIHLSSVKGLYLNIANDLFNDFKRTYIDNIDKTWLKIDNRLLVSAIYGGNIELHQPKYRQAIIKSRCPYPERGMLHSDEICTKLQLKPQWYAKGETIFDFGAAVVCMPNGYDYHESTAASKQLSTSGTLTRAVKVRGADSNYYIVAANFADEAQICDIADAGKVELGAHDCVIIKL